LFFQNLQIAHGPAHIHLALIVIKTSLGHVERILLAMGRIKPFYFYFFIFFLL